jgi:hypothetical protein
VPFTSWAQEEEDIVLDCAVYGIENGTYLPVELLTLTTAFCNKNSHGISIETSFNKHMLLMKQRPRDVHLNTACGANHSVLQLWLVGVGTTLDSTISLTRCRRAISLQVYPLSVVIANYSRLLCHFWKTDVEGFEQEVSLGIN